MTMNRYASNTMTVALMITIVIVLQAAQALAFGSIHHPTFAPYTSIHRVHGHPSTSRDTDSEPTLKQLPKIIIFDLDGCLWTPEMYEIIYFMQGKGAPFTTDPNDELNLQTCAGAPVKLIGDVRSIFQRIHTMQEYQPIQIGISSRTDEPNWARELLTKFTIPIDEDGTQSITIQDVLDEHNGPIEIAQDSKVKHFERIVRSCKVDYQHVLFFDNEYGNCESVAQLGVSVVYCPNGVTDALWNLGVHEEFPRVDGSVICGDAGGC